MSELMQRISSRIFRALLYLALISALLFILCLSITFTIYTALLLLMEPIYAALSTSAMILMVLGVVLLLASANVSNKQALHRKSKKSQTSPPSSSTKSAEESLALCLLAGYVYRSQPTTGSRLLNIALDRYPPHTPQDQIKPQAEEP